VHDTIVLHGRGDSAPLCTDPAVGVNLGHA
jgi:hypothetical protein